MSTKRQPSKQRRQSQNQRQRAALEARRANAARIAREAEAGGGGRSAAAPRQGGVGGFVSRLRGTTAAGRTARTTATGAMPVGHRAALSALLAAVAAAIVGAFFIDVPVARSGEPIGTPAALVAEWSLSALDEAQAAPEATAAEVADAVDEWNPGGEEAYGMASWPLSLGLVLPVVGAGLAFRAVANRSPAKVVNRTMYVTLFGTLLSTQLFLLFIPAVAGVAIAAFQVRKHEIASTMPAPEVADDGIIDVDEADDAALDEVEVDDAIEADEAAESDSLLEPELEDGTQERDRP